MKREKRLLSLLRGAVGRGRVVFVGCCVCILVTGMVRGDFEDTGYGARATGMGNSFVGLADDVYTMMYNPGGMGRVKEMQLGAGYRKMHWGLDDLSELGESVVAFTYPVRGVPEWVSRYVPWVRDWGTAGIGIVNFSAGGLYSERTVTVSYGKTLEEVIERPVYAGVNLKVLSKRYGSTLYTENAVDFTGNTYGRDPVFSGGYGTWAMGIDIGGHYRVSREYAVGAVIRNVNSPDTGLHHESRLPVELKGGVCYQDEKSNILVDLGYRKGDITLASGVERWLLGGEFGVRGGLELGSRELANVSMGGSYFCQRMFRVDYSFKLPLKGVKDTYGTHEVSLVVRFDEGIGKKEEVKKAEEAEPAGYVEALRWYKGREYVRAYEGFSGVAGKVKEGRYHRQSQRYLGKIKGDMEKGARSAEGSKERYYASGLLRYMEKQYEESLREWDEYLKLEPGNGEIREHAERIRRRQEEEKRRFVNEYLNDAKTLYGNREYNKAITKLKGILGVEPGHAEAGMLMGEIKGKMEEEKKAQVQEYYTKGLMYYTDRKYREAVGEWQKCIRLDPEFREAVEYIKRAREEMEKLERERKAEKDKEKEKEDKAIEAAAPAAVIDGKKAEESYNNALIKYSQGNLAEAIAELEEALKNNPGHKSAGEALNRIKSEFDQQKTQGEGNQ